MAGSPTALPPTGQAEHAHNTNHMFALSALTTLFFMWGFITCLNDILIPYLKAMFSLTYTQAMLIQFCFFGAYFVVSLPAGKLISKLGFQRGIVLGLVIAAIGCALFYPAAALRQYNLFLGALFVLASGITILQVSANPFVSILGDAKTASSRLTMTQAFNSLGTTVAPAFGSMLILSAGVVSQGTQTDASGVQFSYLLLCAMLIVLAILFSFLKLPVIDQKNTEHSAASVTPNTLFSVLHHKHLTLGAIGLFLYVGGEVAIGSFLINYIGLENIAALEEAHAAHLITYYWGGAMVGRFIGAAVMQKINASNVLVFNALAGMCLVTFAILGDGKMAMWSLLLVGLCNSIMFPTIFSLAIQSLKSQTAQGSGLLCLAIVGGAIVPLLQGMLADSIGLQASFVLPALCFVYIAFYGMFGTTPKKFKRFEIQPEKL
ncbi:sugar MFS transporter [Pseudoalteromonas byunsanensis]|uniref:Glucose/galactose MFS transporter n=1 Tax=Pseudoalteromonas byunsanensis TaxID=327939 RepID=A0A1S1NB11_9GAMM|nr:sugar MFS transporter [Pseudoalteromonas byunsanensis]OHU96566.1 glucose/galactose MFS transporter [Pseudoalteromonas byunsanensis]